MSAIFATKLANQINFKPEINLENWLAKNEETNHKKRSETNKKSISISLRVDEIFYIYDFFFIYF
jgi:hypothetical protein